MAIEFRCPQCQKLLRVSDESAGARAKCPSCSTVVDVPPADQPLADRADLGAASPLPSANPFAAGEPFQSEPKPFDGSAENPYGSHSSTYQTPKPKASLATEVIPTPTDPGQIISYAWEVWKSNFGLLLGVTVVLFIVNLGFAIVQGTTEAVFAQQGDQTMGQVIGGVISIFGSLIQLFLGIGQVQINLRLLRGEPADFGQLFGGGPLYLRMLGASILFVLMLIAGTILCIVPGIIVMILLWPYFFLIADEKADAIESLGMASKLGQCNVGTSLVIWLVGIGVMLVGFLAACVGVFAAAPLVSLMLGTMYLMMSGQLQPQPKY